VLAHALLMAGRDAEVVAQFGRQADPDDTSPYLAMLVGRAYERLDERDKAVPWLARATQEKSTGRKKVLPNRNGLAAPTATSRSLAQAGNWAAATSHVATLRRRFAGSADIAALSGDVALGRGDATGALELYAEASRVRRSWPLARKAIAAYRMIGDEDAADVLIIRHLAGDPNNIDAALMLAERSIAWDDWGRAALLLDHVAALGGANDLTYRALRQKVVAQTEG
jgi:predicted Zn-dependent protease